MTLFRRNKKKISFLKAKPKFKIPVQHKFSWKLLPRRRINRPLKRRLMNSLVPRYINIQRSSANLFSAWASKRLIERRRTHLSVRFETIARRVLESRRPKSLRALKAHPYRVRAIGSRNGTFFAFEKAQFCNEPLLFDNLKSFWGSQQNYLGADSRQAHLLTTYSLPQAPHSVSSIGQVSFSNLLGTYPSHRSTLTYFNRGSQLSGHYAKDLQITRAIAPNTPVSSLSYARLMKALSGLEGLKQFNNTLKTAIKRKFVFASTFITVNGLLDREVYTKGEYLRLGNAQKASQLAKKPTRTNRWFIPSVSRVRNLARQFSDRRLPGRHLSALMIRFSSLDWAVVASELLLPVRDSRQRMVRRLRKVLYRRRRPRKLRRRVRRARQQVKFFTTLFTKRSRRIPKWARLISRLPRQLKFEKIRSQKVPLILRKGSKWKPALARLAPVTLRTRVISQLRPLPINISFNYLKVTSSLTPGSTASFFTRGKGDSPIAQSSQILTKMAATPMLLRSSAALRWLMIAPWVTHSDASVTLKSRTSHKLALEVQSQLEAFLFQGHAAPLKYSSLWATPSSRFTIRKRLLRFLSTAAFQGNVAHWYYITLTRFVEHITGRKVFLNFGPFVDNCLSFEDRALCRSWIPRLMGFKRRLGHRIFIKESLSVILASLKLKDPTLLSNWIRGMLKRMSFWKYRLIFRYLKFLIRHLVKPNFVSLNMKGFKLRLKGKISVAGNARTRTLFYRVGNTSHAKMSNRIVYDLSLVNTFTGVMGLKLWYLF